MGTAKGRGMQNEGVATPDRARSAERGRRFAVEMMEHLVVPTFVLDEAGCVLVWNKACERLTGVAAEVVMGTADHWKAFYVERRPCLADLLLQSRFADIQAYYSAFSKFDLSDFGVAVETWCDLPGVSRRAYLAIDAGPIYDATGAVVAVVETLRDVTAQREAQDVLESLAALDGLTGLPNRRSFDQALDAEIHRSARSGLPLSLLMLDVDAFKPFNDTYGHGGGDACLKSVASTVAEAVRRAGDMAARYGGEEFAVILPNTDADGTAIVAERIRRGIEALQIEHRASPFGDTVTISVGGATVVGPDPDARGLLAAADAALYAAKRGGRNRAVVTPPPAVAAPTPAPLLDCA